MRSSDKTPRDSHLWTAREIAGGMLSMQARAVRAVEAEADRLAEVIDATTGAMEAGGRMIFVGAGTSGRIAAQDAAELPPTFNWPAARALILIAGGRDALHTPVERAEDDANAGRDAIAALSPGARDVVFGLAASGTTPYVIGALDLARQAGATTVAVTTRPGAPIADVADHVICPETGDEFVNGSTRLAAGTAQKLCLNVITTGVMVRLGRVYEGQMVEMPPTNAKLEARAEAMVADLGRCSPEAARAALAASGGVVKVAIVMERLGVDAPAARARLEEVGGRLAAVLD